MRPALAVLATLVLAGPAAALADPAAFTGTVAGRGVGKAQGLPAQTQKISIPDCVLTLRASESRFDFAVGDAALGGPMTAAKKGSFKIVQPTGDDLTALIAGTETFLTDTLGVSVTVSTVTVKGRHRPNKTGLADKSRMKLVVTGTALGLIPFKANAKLRYAGAAIVN
jgi:hypothetical protein